MNLEFLLMLCLFFFFICLGYYSKNPILTAFAGVIGLSFVILGFITSPIIILVVVIFAIYLFFLTAKYAINAAREI